MPGAVGERGHGDRAGCDPLCGDQPPDLAISRSNAGLMPRTCDQRPPAIISRKVGAAGRSVMRWASKTAATLCPVPSNSARNRGRCRSFAGFGAVDPSGRAFLQQFALHFH
jgi:hypothetical protein